jgi:hypothetical protein
LVVVGVPANTGPAIAASPAAASTSILARLVAFVFASSTAATPTPYAAGIPVAAAWRLTAIPTTSLGIAGRDAGISATAATGSASTDVWSAFASPRDLRTTSGRSSPSPLRLNERAGGE